MKAATAAASSGLKISTLSRWELSFGLAVIINSARFQCPAARSVWSATSLLALWTGAARPKAGASSTHSKRFAQFGGGFAALRNIRAGSTHLAKALKLEYKRRSEERRVGKECRSRWS